MATRYDEVPYANLPFSQARPESIATVAALHGLAAADPREARVLELACGAGANLAGIAAAHPGSLALGVDLAATAIARARAIAGAAGLGNVTFEVADVRDLVDGRLGEFDYVIVHGLYAWVDEELREATLAACRAHLAPDGLAYVAYTSHPGGHLRRLLREMGAFHARDVSDLRDRAERARGLFGLLDGLASSEGPSFYGGVLGEELRAVATGPREMLVHDLLAEEYAPVWFSDFAAAAARHDLGYVADALPEASRRPPWSPAVEAFVAEAAGDDPIAREQYFDMLVLRRFRHSLLCCAGRRATPAVESVAVQGLLAAAAEGAADGGEPQGALLTAALAVLAERPAAVPFEALRDRLGAPADALAAALLEGFDAGRVAFSVVPSPAAAAPGPRPRASALARSQAGEGAVVTTLLNQVVRLSDEPTSRLLRLLDGTRDRATIRRDFGGDGGPGPLSAEALDGALATLARLGLLHV